jgi:hypothetical protein
MNQAERIKTANETNLDLANQQQQTQSQLAEQSRLRLLAEETVRLQEEEARKKTTFGGLGIQSFNERRKLLG